MHFSRFYRVDRAFLVALAAGAASCAKDAPLAVMEPDASTAEGGSRPLAIPKFACPRFATSVPQHEFGEGSTFGQAEEAFPENVFGPPQGKGCCSGGLDVATLGDGGSIVLGFGDTLIVDGPGPDFVVFENPFAIGGDETEVFAELARVEVSPDGESWTPFPCTASDDAACAGQEPVFGNYGLGFDPLDPAVSGGDKFDLADIGISAARFVRITDLDGDEGALDCCFDLDAVGIVNAECALPPDGGAP
jgi:hypothetical protein